MKRQNGVDWFKLVTTSMYIIGIGSFLVALLLSGVLWKDVPEEESEKKLNGTITRDDGISSQRESISGAVDEFNTTEVDEMLAWLESMDGEESTDDEKSTDGENLTLGNEFDFQDEFSFDDEVEYSNPESGLTPEQQREANSIVQQLHEGTDEYRRLMDIINADIPNWTPEFGEQQDQARYRMAELDNELPGLLSQYYFVTRDMDSLERLLPLFEGVMKIELGPGIQEGELFRMTTTPARFLP